MARQYCGALGKIANCQVAVSTALLADDLTWPTTMEWYRPQAWAQDAARRDGAGLPRGLRFREKWRSALTHLRQVRAAGIQIDAILADAASGNVLAFRTAVDRRGVRDAVGVGLRVAARPTGARRRRQIGQIITRWPIAAWHRVCWAQGTTGPMAARFAARRVRPTNSRTDGWLLCERPLVGHGQRKASLLNLPATAALKDLVRVARRRWPIEQQSRERKDELGLDHFEGRS